MKSQSRSALAGSSRNELKLSLAGDRYRGKATDWGIKDRKVQFSCQTLNLVSSQKIGSWHQSTSIWKAGVRARGKLVVRKVEKLDQG